MQPGCIACSQTEGIKVVTINGEPVILCAVHNNPAAIADLEKRDLKRQLGPTAPPTEIEESTEEKSNAPLNSRARRTS
jgi:hypothetical protein